MRFAGRIWLLAVVILLAACGLVSDSPSPSSCDGIPAEWGACDADRPTFSGETCAEVGAEFGAQLSPRAIEIFDGPQTVGGDDRTVNLQQLVILHVQLANKHLRDTGQVVDCDMPEFIEAAETEFSDEFTERVGQNTFFGQTITYEEWIEELERWLVVIDRDETLPYHPTQTDAGAVAPSSEAAA